MRRLVLPLPTVLGRQQTLDRAKVPAPGPAPQLRVPAWTKGKLANGADFIVSEKHDLPLVSFSITFMGGADQIEPAAKRGLAGVTAAMMLEGTTTKDGEALSNALQLLGTSVQTGIGGETGIDPVHVDDGEVRADAGDPRRRPAEPDVPGGRARTAARAAARRAHAGEVAGDRDRRDGVPARPLRHRPSLRTGDDRGHDQGDHARRPGRAAQGLLQARARARHRRRRRERRRREGERG